jgi:hypothetical protein
LLLYCTDVLKSLVLIVTIIKIANFEQIVEKPFMKIDDDFHSFCFPSLSSLLIAHLTFFETICKQIVT